MIHRTTKIGVARVEMSIPDYGDWAPQICTISVGLNHECSLQHLVKHRNVPHKTKQGDFIVLSPSVIGDIENWVYANGWM